MKFSGKIWLLIILKVTKKQGFNLSLEDTFFEKPQGVQLTHPPGHFRVNHPIPNSEFNLLVLWYNPTHSFTKIFETIGGWRTPKPLVLLIQILAKQYKHDWKIWLKSIRKNQRLIKKIKLSNSSLYLTNFEKEKVYLALNIFNEKNSAEILCRAKIMKVLMIQDWNTYGKWPILLRRWALVILVINNTSIL